MPYEDTGADDAPAAPEETWEVIGEAPVFGYEKGDTFEMAIPEEQAQRLQDRGSLRKCTGEGRGGSLFPPVAPPVSTSNPTSDEDGDTGDSAGEGDENE